MSPQDIKQAGGMRRCVNCGEQFKPYHSGQRFCGANAECEREETEAEREAYEERREAAQEDDYERY